MHKLVIQDDEGKTTVVPLVRDELTIGRKEGNTIRLTERNVSRRHAKVVRADGAVTIEDLNSYNGIRVNGSRIAGKVEIQESDRVQIGDYLIEIKPESAHRHVGPTVPIDDGVPVAAASDSESAETIPVAVSPTIDAADGTLTDPETAVDAADDESPRASEPGTGEGEESLSSAASPGMSAMGKAVARLVVLSRPYAGLEFPLDKPSLVIGRTNENDIGIDHRSISRHHAKVIFENGRHTVVDLESSNGVRVNGEDYDKVELRRADIIDLGHVRVRYVEAGEDYQYERDADDSDLEDFNIGRGRGGLWAVVALLLIGGGVAAFMVFGGGERAETAGPAPALPPDAQAVAAIAPGDAAPLAAASDAAVPGPSLESRVATELETARAAQKEADWEEMEAASQRALELQPTRADAAELFETAKAERAHQVTHQKFEAAVAGRKFKQVQSLFEELPESSTYRARAQPEHDRLKGEYVQFQSQVGKNAADRGDCRGQKRAASDVIWPEAGEAILSHECRAPVAAPSDGGQATGEPPNRRPPSDAPLPPETAAGEASYEEVLEEAREAAKDTQFGKALRLCRQALALRPGDQEATMVCSIASCNLKREGDAEKFYSRIKSSSRKAMVRQICLRNGFAL